jgi:hypothetical protein
MLCVEPVAAEMPSASEITSMFFSFFCPDFMRFEGNLFSAKNQLTRVSKRFRFTGTIS